MAEGWSAYWVILGMAAVTYALRIGGFLIMSRVAITPRVRRGLEALPGAIIVATVLPVALAGGVTALIGIVVAAVTMALVRQDLAAVVAGVGAAAFARSLGL